MVDFLIHVADAAIALRRASKKQKKCGQKSTVCFTAVELEKNVTSYEIFFFNSRAHEYCSSMEEQLKKPLATVREKTNPTTWNDIFQLERQSRGP